ncbi:MAG: hypothetical protein JSU58_05660 [Dehalococcoidales bacterium]|nr:MAG: hypothetical protein JSU58_05660 [Dehalococcoidales bacterium]
MEIKTISISPYDDLWMVYNENLYLEVNMDIDTNVTNIERKIGIIGNQTRWWGTLIFIVGLILAITEVNGGIVITALGIVMALQGAIIQYAFKKKPTNKSV